MTDSATPAPTTTPVLVAEPTAIARIRNEIQISDRAKISTYGDRAQRSVTSYADRILSQTRNKELGDTGKLLTDIILKAKRLDPASLENQGFFSKLFGDLRARFEQFKAKFDDVAGQIDAIGIELDRRRERLRTDIAMMDDLHEETKSSILDLDAYIEAGKQFAEHFRSTELPALKAKADAAAMSAGSGNQGLIEAQEFQDAQQALDRLDKRVFYLQQARQVGIQQLPQIRIVQGGDESLMEQLQATTRLTIPLWKQKMVLLLGITRQKEALELQKTVTDATNEMLKQTSEMMKSQALDIEEQSQRGLIDLETLEQANKDLIDTVNGVLKLQDEGRQKRIEVERRMQELSEELRQGLLNTSYSS
ncbi:MAG: toxic anion resistance protein [Pseudomonadota bacterium]